MSEIIFGVNSLVYFKKYLFSGGIKKTKGVIISVRDNGKRFIVEEETTGEHIHITASDILDRSTKKR